MRLPCLALLFALSGQLAAESYHCQITEGNWAKDVFWQGNTVDPSALEGKILHHRHKTGSKYQLLLDDKVLFDVCTANSCRGNSGINGAFTRSEHGAFTLLWMDINGMTMQVLSAKGHCKAGKQGSGSPV